MLASAWKKVPLASLRAREGDDLGLMLLEMWAYVCDVLSFYDETIAHETYLRTARLRPSLRKLVGLLGYVPRPAVAASVKLALLADGRQAVSLLRGTAFRSGSFDNEAPQVFELDADVQIHPLLNRFTLEYSRPATVPTSPDYLLLPPGAANFKPDDPVLIEVQGQAKATQVGVVASAQNVRGEDGESSLKVTFTSSLTFAADTALANVRLSRPTQQASLWTSVGKDKDPEVLKRTAPQIEKPAPWTIPTMPRISLRPSAPVPVVGCNLTVVLDGIYRQIKPGDRLILAKGSEFRWFEVTKTDEKTMAVTAGGPYQTQDKDGKSVTVFTPPVLVPATKLELSGQDVIWSLDDASCVLVHYNLAQCGAVTAEAKTKLAATDALKVRGSLEQPSGYTFPTRFLLEDKDGAGVEVGPSPDRNTGALDLAPGTSWATALTCPVQVYGNVVSASRGETVQNEILGSGDASLANQSFKLRKKPLTYQSAPTADNERGVASTLQIHVNGIRWVEVPSFYGTKPEAQVYIVRRNDEGESVVTFGDGQHGARLPSGTNNVVATYRYGAGAATPPPGSITQLAKPAKGLKSVRNPVAASGGADAESVKDMRRYAPRSALLLGRAVSILDMEAVAAGAPGVRAVRAEWRWHPGQQRPVVQVWYIGRADAAIISQTLRRLSDRSGPISVEEAVGVPVQLSLDVEIDDRYMEADVLAAVRSKLMDKQTGLLSPEQIGIGRPLYRSRIFAAVLAVPGAKWVREIVWNDQPLKEFALSPGGGNYFDLESRPLLLNKKAASNG
jgi:hypothetical protein